jgi:repressor LexA
MARNQVFTKQQVLMAIQRWIVENGMAPTIEELRSALDAGSTRTVLRYLRQLEVDGDIQRWHGARGLRVLKHESPGANSRLVPIVGVAPAGPTMLAEENREGWVQLPESFLSPPSARFFLLRVRGDSMDRAELVGGRIESGDLVLVRSQSVADPGQVVVALLDGEATIKRLVKAPGYWALKPESTNPRHHPIIVETEALIQGVVTRVLKAAAELVNNEGLPDPDIHVTEPSP